MNLAPVKTPFAALCLLSSLVLAGCGDPKPADTKDPTAVHKHEHKPPHGGTPVVLGHEEFHLELVLDSSVGVLQAFVFDGELENYIRIAAPSFEVVATFNGRKETLVFKAVTTNATGEKVGDTALFEAGADWLKTATNFDAVLTDLTIRTKRYQSVAFNFPMGNEHDEPKAK